MIGVRIGENNFITTILADDPRRLLYNLRVQLNALAHFSP